METQTNFEYEIDGGNEIVRYTLFGYIEIALKNKRINILKKLAKERNYLSGNELQEKEVPIINFLGIASNSVHSATREEFNLEEFENERFSNVLDRLSAKARKILYLHFICELSLTQIAAEENIKVMTVSDYIERSLELMMLHEKEIFREFHSNENN